MSMHPYAVHANPCVVCQQPLDESYGARGITMMVFHPQATNPCGYWIHEHCRGNPDAPMCPCGAGRADQGVHHSHFASLSSADGDEESDGDGITMHYDDYDEADAEGFDPRASDQDETEESDDDASRESRDVTPASIWAEDEEQDTSDSEPERDG